MAEFNLGQVAFFDKGVFSLSETYTKWNFVTTIDSTYLCVSDTPIIGKEVTNTTYWKCIADGKPATLAAGYATEQGELAQTARENIGGDLTLTEEALANVLNTMRGEIAALKQVIAQGVLTKVQIGEADIQKLKYQGSEMTLSGVGVPSVIPDFLGQRYVQVGVKVWTAVDNSSVADWK